MLNEDLNYHRRRADAELTPARRSTEPRVVAAHRRLAHAYLQRIGPHGAEGPAGHA